MIFGACLRGSAGILCGVTWLEFGKSVRFGYYCTVISGCLEFLGSSCCESDATVLPDRVGARER